MGIKDFFKPTKTRIIYSTIFLIMIYYILFILNDFTQHCEMIGDVGFCHFSLLFTLISIIIPALLTYLIIALMINNNSKLKIIRWLFKITILFFGLFSLHSEIVRFTRVNKIYYFSIIIGIFCVIISTLLIYLEYKKKD
ncbi:MAG: hypothetical protein WC413_01510 [Candidatus Nanoarchaeia archaeon]